MNRGDLDQRYRRPLMAFFLHRTHSSAEAEDLTQEVFVRILGTKNFSQLEQPEGYVFTIATNLFKDRNRSAWSRRTASTISLDSGAPPDHPNLVEDRAPERVLVGRESVGIVTTALSELPERTSAIFVLSCFEAMAHRQIGSRYGISVSAVEKHVARALAHLSQRVLAQ